MAEIVRAEAKDGAGEQEFTLKNVQLFKNETLGVGSYGAVCKAKCDQLICAAKLLYPVLFQMQAPDPGKEHRPPLNRFEQECRFLSRVNHPNIVQYLGTYRDPETNAPVLLMELMDESLTHFLESSPGDIPYHIQVNLSQDIAQALAFLHANGIIHRDLSSNNVLLIAGSRAKVTDFGMSRFEDINKTRLATMTTCPGTPAFMSPEALDEPPVYTEKLDNFSFGVLLVQIVTRQFPAPTNRFETERIPDRRNPARSVEARILIPEIERRQAHISLIEPTHPLLPIALECLKDEAVERPSSQQLCQSLAALKRTVKFEESTQLDAVVAGSEQQDLVQSLHCIIEAKEKQVQAKEEVVLAQDRWIQSLHHEAEAREQQLRRLNRQLESNEEITATLQQTITQRDQEITELKGMLANKSLQPTDNSRDLASAPTTTETSLTLTWDGTPCKTVKTSGTSCVLIGHKVFFTAKAEVYVFNSTTYQWYPIDDHPLDDFTLVNVGNMLTTVGGRSRSWIGTRTCSNKIYSYFAETWREHYPPMPTERWACAARNTNYMLVVAGGDCDGKLTKLTAIVEILNTLTNQWSGISSLPFPATCSSVSICGEYIYVLPRHSSEEDKYSAVRCTFSNLVQSTSSSDIWEKIATLSVSSSTLIAVSGHLLAVGGKSFDGDGTKQIHHYDSVSNSWQVLSEMTTARSSCCVVILPSNQLMVVGGNSDKPTTEIASIMCVH